MAARGESFRSSHWRLLGSPWLDPYFRRRLPAGAVGHLQVSRQGESLADRAWPQAPSPWGNGPTLLIYTLPRITAEQLGLKRINTWAECPELAAFHNSKASLPSCPGASRALPSSSTVRLHDYPPWQVGFVQPAPGPPGSGRKAPKPAQPAPANPSPIPGVPPTFRTADPLGSPPERTGSRDR